jgi:amino acid transporter
MAMATTTSGVTNSSRRPHSGGLKKISLAPFVAVLYAYCSGGPFGFEAIISTAGPGMALIFLLTVPLLFSIPVSLATAEMSSAMPVEGGFYRWTRAAFGNFWGFQCGWWNWTGTFLMSAAYGAAMADYLAGMTPLTHAQHWALAFVFLLIVTLINVLGIRLVGNMTLVLLLVALLPTALFTVLGFLHFRYNPFHPMFPPARPWQHSFGDGLALALWVYSGYEQLSTVAEEVENPRRNFPLGLAIVVPLAMASFVLPYAAGVASVDSWQKWEVNYFVIAARELAGPWLGFAMFGAAAICTFVLLDSTILSASRVPFSMAQDGLLHRSLARLHPRYATPARAIVIALPVFAILAQFSVVRLIAIYAWFRAASSVLTLFSVWRLRRTAPELPREFVVPGGGSGIAAAALLPTLLFAWALFNSDPAARWWGLAGLAAGPLVYGLNHLKQVGKCNEPTGELP